MTYSSAIFLNHYKASAENKSIAAIEIPTGSSSSSSSSSSSTSAAFCAPLKREAPDQGVDDSTFGDTARGHSSEETKDREEGQQQSKTSFVASPSDVVASVCTNDEGSSNDKGDTSDTQHENSSQQRKNPDDLEQHQGENSQDGPPPPKKMKYCDEEEEDDNKKKQVSTAEISSPPKAKGDRGANKDNETTSQEHNGTATKAHVILSAKRGSTLGRRGDPRMHKAVAARLTRPELTPFQALVIGGFRFPDHVNEVSIKYADGPIFDADGVLLSQRKNQLSRRLRHIRRRYQRRTPKGKTAPYYTKQLLGDHLESFLPKEKTTGNALMGDNETEGLNYGSSSNNNDNLFLAPSVSASSAAYQPPEVPSGCFPIQLNQQVNTFQHLQQMTLLKELANQQHLQNQLSLLNSAAHQPYFFNTQTASSRFGSALRSFGNNLTTPGSSSLQTTHMFNFANQVLSGSPIYSESTMERTALLHDEGNKDIKRRALIAAGFNENQINESLLQAMDGHLGFNNFQH